MSPRPAHLFANIQYVVQLVLIIGLNTQLNIFYKLPVEHGVKNYL